MTSWLWLTLHINMILIHTSVKLVTNNVLKLPLISSNFNPHEREARDARRGGGALDLSRHFNPHEREARDELYH